MSFSCRRGRLQEAQKVGSAVAIAVAIALRVVEVFEVHGAGHVIVVRHVRALRHPVSVFRM